MAKSEPLSDTARFFLGFEQGVNPIDKLIPGLLTVAENPQIAKIAIWMTYNPPSILDAFSVYDVLKLISKPTTVTVTGETTPAMTLMLQGAQIRRATQNTWFRLSPLIGANIRGLKAADIETLSGSLADVDKAAKSAIAQRAGMSIEQFDTSSVEHKLISAQAARIFGENGLVDVII